MLRDRIIELAKRLRQKRHAVQVLKVIHVR